MILAAGLPNTIASTLPENSHSGYVAAAYIVFFVLVLVYVAIMAYRLTRVERSVRALKGAPHDGGHPEGHTQGAHGKQTSGRGDEQADGARERETV